MRALMVKVPNGTQCGRQYRSNFPRVGSYPTFGINDYHGFSDEGCATTLELQLLCHESVLHRRNPCPQRVKCLMDFLASCSRSPRTRTRPEDTRLVEDGPSDFPRLGGSPGFDLLGVNPQCNCTSAAINIAPIRLKLWRKFAAPDLPFRTA